MAFAIEAVWPLLLDVVHFFSCRHYPLVTITIVMWLGKNIPEIVKSLNTSAQEDVGDDANLQQAFSPNRREDVPGNQQSDTGPGSSTIGHQPAPWTSGLQAAASFSIQESVLQNSRTFASSTQDMLEGISPLGSERPRAVTALPMTVQKSTGSTAMIERTSVSKTAQKTKKGTLSAITPAPGGSSSAPLSRSG